MTFGARPGEPSSFDEPVEPAAKGFDLVCIEQAFQYLHKLGVLIHLTAQPAQVIQDVGREGLARKVPDHAAEFRLRAKAHAMVNRPHLAL